MVINEQQKPVAFYDEDQQRPGGTIEITEAQWLDFLQNQRTRRWNGEQFIEVEPDSPPLDEYKARVSNSIDNLATEAKKNFITIKPGQDLVYTMKYEEARNLIANNDFSEELYPLLAQEAVALSQQPETLASVIINMFNSTKISIAKIEALRIKQKSKIKEALTVAEIEEIFTETKSLMAEYI